MCKATELSHYFPNQTYSGLEFGLTEPSLGMHKTIIITVVFYY